MLPLHKDAQGAKKGADFHAGLWYDRFFNTYDNKYKVADEGKLAWIQTVTASPVGDKNALARAANRQHAVAETCGGKTLVMTTDWHFVTGMGNNHPVENGFAWHHTLGVPYLTGAAVKGMVRAWCEVWQDFDDSKIKQWFGDEDQAGDLIFFDAIPVKPVQLKADIMTPHYGKWYTEGDQEPKKNGSNIPADWHDPVPIPFLVVNKGQTFQFAVAKRACATVDLNQVVENLQEALQWIGAGAKTATGYGRMCKQDSEEQVAGKIWLDKMIKQIVHENHAEEDTVLRGNPLFQHWLIIEDADLKAAVWKEIESKWRKLSWWDKPPSRSAKKLKIKYVSAVNINNESAQK